MLKYLKNKFLLAGLIFAAWMLFFDRNDLLTQWKRRSELSGLQASEKKMSVLITETREELKMLKTNPSTIERYAREKFMMKKDNEDLFIVVNDGETGK